MKLNFKYILLISMLLLGIGFGILHHFVIMPLIGNKLIQSISFGIFASLTNFFMILVIYKKYQVLKRSNRLLEKNLIQDKLTGLLNRRAFDDDILELSLDEIFSVIFIDIDNFRIFNNKYGHHVGDLVLQKISNIIRDSVRASDKTYRYGGEEIVVLLRDCGRKRALEIAENIRLNINELDNNPYSKITVSLGVSSYPEDGLSVDDIIRASDKALLIAKSLGKNQVYNYIKDDDCKVINE